MIFPLNCSNQNSAISRRQFFSWIIAVLILFSAGYVIFHAKEAAVSGSWKYIITHGDEYGYWAFAKGASETPISDGNPFYYEERGIRQSVPYTTSFITGQIAKLFRLPILWFFPVWHIGMPFVMWLTLFLCLTRIWKYPPSASCAVSLLILLSTIYLRGQAQFILFRYSRPGDGLWLMILWLSIAMNLENHVGRKTIIACMAAAALLWLHPYYIILPVLVIIPEMFWQFTAERNKRSAVALGIMLLATLLASVTYVWYVYENRDHNPWVLHLLPNFFEGFYHWKTAYALWGGIALAIGFSLYVSKKISKLDRLILFVLFAEPLIVTIQVFMKSNFMLASHRYYFLVIEIACLTGWLVEKTRTLVKSEKFRKIDIALAGSLLIFEILMVTHKHTNYLLYGPANTSRFSVFDNSWLLLGLLPLIYLPVWIFQRFQLGRKVMLNRYFVIAFIAVFSITGYGLLKSQLNEESHKRFPRPFPFNGAIEWLQAHGQKNEVILSIPYSDGWNEDYVTLYTDLKIYCNQFHAQELSIDPVAAKYRRLFCAQLLLGVLDEIPLGDFKTMKEKIDHLRLNYILLELPTPGYPVIKRQLKSIAQEVYRDPHCILWKIK